MRGVHVRGAWYEVYKSDKKLVSRKDKTLSKVTIWKEIIHLKVGKSFK